VNTTLPKGASASVALAGRMVVKKYGRDRLGTVAKLHFKTTQQVLPEP
jgi:ribonuclease HIII